MLNEDTLVKRLRDAGTWIQEVNNVCDEAADRIETLEAALRQLDNMMHELLVGDMELFEVGDFIDAALGEKKDD